MTVTIELSKNPKSVKGIIYKSRFLQKKKRNKKKIDAEFQRLPIIKKNPSLVPKLKEKEQNRIYFLLTYETLWNVKQIINEHWYLLQINSNLRTLFKSIIAYRPNKNLGDLL